MVKTFVIAECATTWRIGTKSARHIEYAKQCILIAKQAGANAVKFQWVSDPRAMEKRRKVLKGTYTMLAWPKAWLNVFAAECEKVGIEFMCTVFLPIDIATIAPFVKRFKVASLEAMDLDFISSHLRFKKPMFISTGAMTRESVEILRDHAFGYAEEKPWWWQCHEVKLLQCSCAYPSPLNAMQLIQIQLYGADGLSDHSGDVLTGALAVACGAKTIEFHIRLDETRPENSDYQHSLPPAKFREYVANIRKAELMLGDGIKKVEACEQPMLAHRVMT
jgi:N-acetylneuraminate synthase